MTGRNVEVMRMGWLPAALAAVALAAPPAGAQTQIKPYMMIVFDTSGSMNWNYAGSDTSGDGSRDPWGGRWCCPGTGTAANPSRLYPCKSAMYRMVAATGDVIFGLTKFPQYWVPGGRQMDWYLNNQVAGARDVLRYDGECSSGTVTDYRVVPFGEESANEVLMWMDHREYSGANTPISATERELRSDGPTPIAWTLDRTREYFGGVLQADPYWNCRPYRVVLLTDGEDNCPPNDPARAVRALRTTARTGGGTKDIRTCVIGYGSPGLAQLNAMALEGRCFDTTTTAYVPTNENELAVALFEIVRGTVLTEICNNLDDDCDGLIDEGFTKYCNLRASPPITGRTLCTDPGEACNGVDDNCDTRVDEGVQNACGGCGPVPTEICNWIDDDCDGETNEGLVCTDCVPEICDGFDNNCDTRVDEGLGTRACGSNIGECRYGSQACVGGAWGACTGGTGPSAETCDNRDNDCDGMTDGLTRTCGTDVGVCELGAQVCVAGTWGACIGGYNGTAEICNLLDDNCNGSTDEGNPGGGAPCGSAIGECRPGTVRCVAGTLVCDGGVLPVPEICDGRDNDCDGETDEGNPGGGATCYTGPPATRRIGICEDGVERCVGGRMVCTGERTPAAEDCNGLDDDCDGLTDEELAETTCGSSVGECRPGTRRCVAGAWVCEGETPPRPEICNLRDDDCDGATDEGNPGGGVPCGWNPAAPETWDLGECEPGIYRCVSGALVCEGVIGPEREICNGLDDDCNGLTDDGLAIGEPCGEDRGDCEPGRLRCIDGAVRCVGGIGPAPETCDCADNDCDGTIDEDVVCPGASVCLDCSCALPCDPANEFSCPMGLCCECGRTGDPMACYCVRCGCGGGAACGTCQHCENEGGVERCVPVACGECDRCDPTRNDCVPLCDRVSCPPPTECLCGECVAGCYVTGCPPGRRCQDEVCVPDPCHPVSCAPPLFCREGLCYEPCEPDDVCPTGEICFDGECVADLCHGVECPPGIECVGGVCESAPGTPCEVVECQRPLVCRGGDCTEHECHYIRCADGYHCERGTCVTDTDPGEPGTDAGDGGGGGDGARDAPDGDAAGGAGSHVLATGTGGCVCAAAGAGSPAGGPLALLGLAAIGAALRRRSRGRGRKE